jgi:hypothetical protein
MMTGEARLAYPRGYAASGGTGVGAACPLLGRLARRPSSNAARRRIRSSRSCGRPAHECRVGAIGFLANGLRRSPWRAALAGRSRHSATARLVPQTNDRPSMELVAGTAGDCPMVAASAMTLGAEQTTSATTTRMGSGAFASVGAIGWVRTIERAVPFRLVSDAQASPVGRDQGGELAHREPPTGGCLVPGEATGL